MIHAVFGVIVGLVAGACLYFAVSELIIGAPEQSTAAICGAAGAIVGAIVGGAKDIAEAIRDTM